MRIIFSFLALAFLFTSCDDGDIITAELEFGDTFEITSCDGKFICYKIKTDPSESLSIVIDEIFESLDETVETLISTNIDDTNALLVVLDNNNPSYSITASNPFNYRTYSNTISDNVFCSAIPPSNLGVINDYISTQGTATFIIVLTEDDNDGIPAAFEDIDGDGDLDNDDTDGDGLPNYLDDDDDGDNVKTATEMPNFSTEFQLTLALDTDEDTIPNYLDADDDQDGVPTINEDADGNLNPANDIENNVVGANYLNNEVTNNISITEYRVHNLNQSFRLQLTLTGIVLPILTQDVVEFGSFTTTDSRTITPSF